MAKLSDLTDTDYLPAPEPIPADIPRVYIDGNQPSYSQGNIDLYNRPIVKNDDGTISTVKSKSFNFDGKEILLPTVSDDGKILEDADVIKQFRKTGKHLGEFKTPEEATKFAEKLHEDQDKYYSNQPSSTSSKIDKIINSLFRDDDKRYQLWPEKVVREALTGAHDVMSGKTPQYQVDPDIGDVHTSPQMIEKAQAISALAGTGGLGGVTDATLGATPFLRPALKYKDRLYKGKEGQSHQDVIPDALYPEFNKMAMSGEDISHYNFGFHNDKGHFLSREDALKYGIDTGIIDPQAGKFGALTSTLMADSSKPGMAIESQYQDNDKFKFTPVEHIPEFKK